jgi:hypothetical protein
MRSKHHKVARDMGRKQSAKREKADDVDGTGRDAQNCR